MRLVRLASAIVLVACGAGVAVILGAVLRGTGPKVGATLLGEIPAPIGGGALVCGLALLGWASARSARSTKHREWRRQWGVPAPEIVTKFAEARILFVCGLLSLALLALWVSGIYLPRTAATALSVACGASALITGGGTAWLERRTRHKFEALLREGPVCLACSYPLRGLDSPTCPECGATWSQWYLTEHGRPVLPMPKRAVISA